MVDVDGDDDLQPIRPPWDHGFELGCLGRQARCIDIGGRRRGVVADVRQVEQDACLTPGAEFRKANAVLLRGSSCAATCPGRQARSATAKRAYDAARRDPTATASSTSTRRCWSLLLLMLLMLLVAATARMSRRKPSAERLASCFTATATSPSPPCAASHARRAASTAWVEGSVPCCWCARTDRACCCCCSLPKTTHTEGCGAGAAILASELTSPAPAPSTTSNTSTTATIDVYFVSSDHPGPILLRPCRVAPAAGRHIKRDLHLSHNMRRLRAAKAAPHTV